MLERRFLTQDRRQELQNVQAVCVVYIVVFQVQMMRELKNADKGIERENGVEADDEAAGTVGLKYAGASGPSPG